MRLGLAILAICSTAVTMHELHNTTIPIDQVTKAAFARLIAVHCSKGKLESRTAQLSCIYNPIEANINFW